jgi:hypothetical protein
MGRRVALKGITWQNQERRRESQWGGLMLGDSKTFTMDCCMYAARVLLLCCSCVARVLLAVARVLLVRLVPDPWGTRYHGAVLWCGTLIMSCVRILAAAFILCCVCILPVRCIRSPTIPVKHVVW